MVKLAAFAGLAATLAVAGYRGAGVVLTQNLNAIFEMLSWVAVALCLARGLPVIIESMGRLLSPVRE